MTLVATVQMHDKQVFSFWFSREYQSFNISLVNVLMIRVGHAGSIDIYCGDNNGSLKKKKKQHPLATIPRYRTPTFFKTAMMVCNWNESMIPINWQTFLRPTKYRKIRKILKRHVLLDSNLYSCQQEEILSELIVCFLALVIVVFTKHSLLFKNQKNQTEIYSGWWLTSIPVNAHGFNTEKKPSLTIARDILLRPQITIALVCHLKTPAIKR